MYNNAVYFHHRINRDWKEVATIKGISNFFTCMDMDNDGNVWVGTSKSGLRYIDGKTFEVTHLPGMRLINGEYRTMTFTHSLSILIMAYG